MAWHSCGLGGSCVGVAYSGLLQWRPLESMSITLSDADLDDVMRAAIEEGSGIDLNPIVQRLQVDRRDLLNQVALAVALRFTSNSRDFEFCDDVMNGLIGAIVDLSLRGHMPEPAFSIYQAFDAGEYCHHGDPREVCPWEKYTRPELERILAAVE